MLEEGNGHKKALHFSSPPRRVVSLVPSLTESLFDLGFGDAVVGITDYCVHPAEKLGDMPRIGGPKNPRVEDIIRLHPDLVLANWEENTRQTVEALEQAGIPVWVTFPKSVRQSLDVLWALASIFKSNIAAARLKTLETTLDWVTNSVSQHARLRYFCPIWHDLYQNDRPWWMVFNRDTYSHDLLEIMGGINIFADRQRLYPLSADLGLAAPEPALERDGRYPRVTLEEIINGQPDLILLPSEPMEFGKIDLEHIRSIMAETPAVQNNRVYLVDGSLITWHGTRLAYALRELPGLFTL